MIMALLLSVLVATTRPEKDHSNFMHDWFWVNKTHFLAKGSILFVGDSRTYRGISPASVNEIFPDYKTLNLGYSSGGLNTAAFEFAAKQLDTTSNFNVIVLGVSPYSLTEEARKNEHLLQELQRPTAEIMERKYVNPYLTIFEPIKIVDYQSKDPINYFRIFHDDGWVESYKEPYDDEEALVPYRTSLKATQLSETSMNETMDFVEKASNNGIKIYAFRPPTTQKMEALENEVLGFDEKAFQKSFENRGGIWIEIPDRYSFTSYDGSHLHFDSAKKLSNYLAKRINE